MAKTLIVKPLGLVVRAAGLVTLQQVKIALEDRQILTNLKIGRIIAMRGWIVQQTADFFDPENLLDIARSPCLYSQKPRKH